MRPTTLLRRRLRWRCRRGTKELDVLLERFLARGFDALDDARLEAFAALLEHPDPDILAWLVGERPVVDTRLAAIVATVRASALAPPTD